VNAADSFALVCTVIGSLAIKNAFNMSPHEKVIQCRIQEFVCHSTEAPIPHQLLHVNSPWINFSRKKVH
jgi:hypothetical protein